MSVHELPQRPRSVLLTGVTGFVGQAVLERFVREDVDVHVVVRARKDVSGEERLDEVLTRNAFDRWRSEVGPDGVAAARARLHVIEADLAEGLPPLPADLDLVVHSASTVSFDEPWDAALRTNVLGPAHLYDALHAAGVDPHVVHVSTSYVGTDRVDVALEEPVAHDVDWRAEVEDSFALRTRLTEEAGGDPAAARDIETALRTHGRRRARELGWTDSYTMSKALGERVAEECWAAGGHRLTILRPTIIESAVQRPHPGWLDGFKVADPLIAAYARDRLFAFPGHADAVVDIVPVDVVVDAALAAARIPHDAPGARYLQVGSSVSNPITLDEFRAHVEEQVAAHPWPDRAGRPIRPRPWRFLSPDELDSWAERRATMLDRAARALELVPFSMGDAGRRRVEAASRGLTLMRDYVAIYQPYTCSRTIYDDTQTRRLLARAEQLGIAGALDVTRIDWRTYLGSVHMPSLARLAQERRRRSASRRRAAEARTAPERVRRPHTRPTAVAMGAVV
ncbi:SDR family oxidoreductase [Mobilicoccus massiliensis]|uniref:SDR family oxidoreductase n=1 Tax=Mobilicoccus massiliensis TaxID=1522310 RepID=UPI000694D8F9|nr:SDR family oxidoreductase [Mobilicoccus massiliensis]